LTREGRGFRAIDHTNASAAVRINVAEGVPFATVDGQLALSPLRGRVACRFGRATIAPRNVSSLSPVTNSRLRSKIDQLPRMRRVQPRPEEKRKVIVTFFSKTGDRRKPGEGEARRND
jgi:hypothetical protein